MRRISSTLALTCCLGVLWLCGCGKKDRPNIDETAACADNGQPAAPSGRPAPLLSVPNQAASTSVAPPLTQQEQYDAALLDALDSMAQLKYPEALTSLQAAQKVQDTEQIRGQIERVRGLIDQQAAAERTARDIQTVLDDGKADEAAQLATAGLQQFGGADAPAEALTVLKRQADALTATQLADQAARQSHFRLEGEAALRDQNLRAAAVAFEGALQYGEEPALARQAEEVRQTLARYDDGRRRARELRADPSQLEDALAALQEAARAWDTLQVRQEIDEYTLALQKRRERISVADFEVRGDVGIPAAGRVVAEELLPRFKPRFDPVERGQFTKVIDELRLEASDLAANDNGRRQVGELAKVRYLVLGSVTALNGLTVNAHVVDVRTGLVIQSAKIVASTPNELTARLPELAGVLMMNDDQKMAYELQQARQEAIAAVPVTQVYSAPPPVAPAPPQTMPPPVVTYTVRPPDFGNVRAADFIALPPPPPPGGLTAAVIVERDIPAKQRLLSMALELGDNLFLRGRVEEAHTQFQLALNLSPGRQEVALRIDRCRPLLPPPPPVVVAAPTPPVVVVGQPTPPIVIVRPPRLRVAVLNFVVDARPGYAPPGFGDWAAEQIACYFTPQYEVIDRGEVFWYMGRLGLTVRDVLTDPCARRWLGRALNVRFFVFGLMEQTASFNVSTHLMDVESGTQHGGGNIHVKDQQELKLRLGELAKHTVSDPAQKAALDREAQENERQLNEARRLLSAGQAQQAAALCRDALKANPNHAGLQAVLQQAEQQQRQAALEEARRRDADKLKAEAEAVKKKQEALAREAEAARQKAQQEAAAQSEAARRAQQEKRQKAYDDLIAQAQKAKQQGNAPQAVQLLQSAVALKPGGDAGRELAAARAQADEAARRQAADAKAARAAKLKEEQESALARSRAQVAEEARRREAEEQARKKTRDDKDQAAYDKLVKEGQQQLTLEKYDAALASFQSARQLKATEEVDRLLTQAREKKALATAQKEGAATKAALERRLAEQKAAREQADMKAKQDRDQYTRLLRSAQQAYFEHRYDAAIAKYQEAGKLFRSEAVLTGLRQAEQARDRDKPTQEISRPRPAATPVTPPPQGNTPPRRTETEPQTSPKPPATNAALYQRQMARGAMFEKQFKHADAVRAYQDALAASPGDAKAAAALRNAEFTLHLSEGRKALAAKKNADAAKEFEEALKLKPESPEAKNGLKRAREQK